MLRVLLYIILAYFVWRMLRNVFRLMMSSREQQGGYVRDTQPGGSKPKQEYKNVTDAEFEDLPKRKEDGSTNAPQ